ncbi:hypothetical protein K435DRAFT_802544 [Dendrothele bispora CBS 962.96]|uniref:Uncharacterized protein n=1 Tax=Dendrothele bispora (strain CBS 962.96) TaxID=1314807 RepID=A0A4S8LKM0_DENBC|nr:hypothetical protein K435DRAFT_802544 [Dendrothele bispora CBS 962.96]
MSSRVVQRYQKRSSDASSDQGIWVVITWVLWTISARPLNRLLPSFSYGEYAPQLFIACKFAVSSRRGSGNTNLQRSEIGVVIKTNTSTRHGDGTRQETEKEKIGKMCKTGMI